jgi:hypothetical protein
MPPFCVLLDRWCIVVFVVVGFQKMSISREELLRIIHKSKIRISTTHTTTAT